MSAQTVFLLWHAIDPDDDDNTKLLGTYSTRALAEDRIARCQAVSGFEDFPEGYTIDEYTIDKDEWTQGFVQIDPGEWVREFGATSQQEPTASHGSGTKGPSQARIDISANVELTLTKAEALVLFEWLQTQEESDATPGDQAEKQALWNLACLLERDLVELFLPDYKEQVQAAKASLTPDEEEA